MNEYPRAMYRAGRDVQTDSGWRAYLVVADAAEQATAEADGWHTSADYPEPPPPPVVEPASDDVPPDDAPPTRAELEQKAAELGISFDGRTTDRKLGEKIAAALKV